MRNEREIRRLMQAGMDAEPEQSRTRLAVSRARRQVGQQDTMAFALVKIWAALARLLAPLFARFNEEQAEAILSRTRDGDKSVDNDNTN